MNRGSINIYHVRTEEGIKNAASPLSKEDVFANGLIPEAIIGYFINEKAAKNLESDGFAGNSLFVEFLHKSIAQFAPFTKSFKAAVRKQKNGWVYLIDQRTPDPKGNVQPEDIIGAFEVKGGKVIEGSYAPNKNYRLLSSNGFFDPGPELNKKIIEKLHKMNTFKKNDA